MLSYHATGVPALGAARAREDDRFLGGDSEDADVREAADDRAEEEEDYRCERGHFGTRTT